jgi:hypothetical protein
VLETPLEPQKQVGMRIVLLLWFGDVIYDDTVLC